MKAYRRVAYELKDLQNPKKKDSQYVEHNAFEKILCVKKSRSIMKIKRRAKSAHNALR